MDAPTILTPDQRLRVFVSSTLNELADERAAARRAIERLHMTPVMFELGARPYPPRSLYLAYLRQSHVFVGVYGEQYGWVAPDMAVSGLEDELRHADAVPMLLYVKSPAPNRDARLAELIGGLAGASYKQFGCADELEALLADDLAVLVTERFTAGSKESASPPPTVPRPPSEFVGRTQELAELVDLVTADRIRLVTLTGPGGIGKTRLAIEVAASVTGFFSDGVTFVPLASRGPEDFLQAVAAALQLKDLGQQPLPQLLADHLRGRRQLLVLDNFEQLITAADAVCGLIEQTDLLRVLVTSRTALRLTGEEEYPVPPLGLPRVTHRVEDVTRAESTQLFARRVAAVRRGYRVTADDAETVARICNRLDGMPLALELVAARANAMTVNEVAARLDRVLDLSTRAPDVPQRQRTLRQTMDWSYAQLPPRAGAAFAQLGAFAAPFSLAAAEAVVGVDGDVDVIDLLATLVDHSLLRPTTDGSSTRFAMLEIVREYARSLLDAEASDAVLSRHAAYFRDVALAAFTGLRGPTQREVLAQLDRDAADIAAASEWLLAHGRRAEVADMCWALWSYHWLRSSLTEASRWTQGALSAAGPLPPLQRARLLAADGFLATWRLEYDVAAAEIGEAIRLADREDDEDLRLLTAIMLIIVGGGSGDETDARAHAAEALELARARHDPWSEVAAVVGLCWLDAAAGRLAGRESAFTDAAASARQLGDPLMLGMALANLAELLLWQGRQQEAAAALAESLTLLAGLHMAYPGLSSLHSAAVLLARQGEWTDAVRIQAATDAAMSNMHAGLWPPWIPRRDRLLAEAQAQLDACDYAAAAAAGSELTFERAAEVAVAKLTRGAPVPP